MHPRAEIRFVTDRKFYKVVRGSLDSEGLNDVRPQRVLAGKFRRYSHFRVVDYIKHPSIMLANLWDVLKIGLGILQSQVMLARFRPNVVFIKGGYVGLPVGLAAGLLWPRVPIVIHDSDTVPGLANRVLSRFAVKIATGMPLKNYSYDKAKSVYTGIPIANGIKPVSEKKQAELKARFGFETNRPLVLVTGGGLGAKRLNDAVLAEQKELCRVASIALIAGHDQFSGLPSYEETPNFKVYEFVTEGFDGLLGAADIVVSRAGATTIVELAALAKAVILVPNAMLPSSHQPKNAKVLADIDAAVVLSDDRLAERPQLLTQVIKDLLGDDKKRLELASNLHQLAKPHAARDLAEIIVKAAK